MVKRTWKKLSRGEQNLLTKMAEHGCWSGGNFVIYIYLEADGWIQPAISEDDQAVWTLTDEGREAFNEREA